MIVQCEKCHAPYEVDESSVGPEGLAVSCSACQYAFRVTRKVFFIAETLQPEHGLQPVQVTRASEPEAKPEPAPVAAAPVAAEAAAPIAKKRAVRLALRTKHYPQDEAASSSSGLRVLLLVVLATAAGVVWLRQMHPEYYQSARIEIDHTVDSMLSSVQGKKIVDPAARQTYLDGRGASVFDTEASYLKAIGLYRRALEIDPTYAAAHGALSEAAAELAQIYREQNRPGEAKPWLEEALKSGTRGMTIDPHNIESRRGLAAYERLEGEFMQAQEHLNEASAADPRNVETQVALARNYLAKKGLEDMALGYLGKAIDADERSVRAHRYLALAYERQGKTNDALAEWQKVLDLNGEHTLAQAEIERLRNPAPPPEVPAAPPAAAVKTTTPGVPAEPQQQ